MRYCYRLDSLARLCVLQPMVWGRYRYRIDILAVTIVILSIAYLASSSTICRLYNRDSWVP